MATYLEIAINQIAVARDRAKDLERADFTTDDLRTVLKEAGGHVEIFLKSAAFPSKNQRDTFYDFIEELKTEGVSDLVCNALHKLREGYNQSKHDPLYSPTLGDVQRILHDSADALSQLSTFNFGKLRERITKRHRRVVWLFAWDHIIGGDTEIHICVPSDGEIERDLDFIYVDGLKWDDLVAELKQIGRFEIGPHLFPADIYHRVASEGDFLAGGVFEGEYRQLMRTLAKYEYRQNLLPGLNRHDTDETMFQAIALATVDVCNRLTSAISPTDMAKQIAVDAEKVYAVPPDYRMLNATAKYFADLLSRLDVEIVRSLAGPTWTSSSPKLLAESKVVDEKIGVCVDAEGTLRLLTD